MGLLRLILYFVVRVLNFVILVYCVMSWFVTPGTRLYDFYVRLHNLLQPLFMPARKLLSRFNLRIPIDLAPWLTMVFLTLIYRILLFII